MAGLTRRPAQRGAALLVAMMIVALVATLASAMVWQQWRAVQVESAERARAQSTWILNAGLDWARLILREDGKEANGIDHLGEPWAVPLAESRLSAFLAADKDHTDDALDAFFSGYIVDAQSRYNLRNLLDGQTPPKIQEAQLKILAALCKDAELAAKFAKILELSRSGATGDGVFLEPHSLAQFAWFGMSREMLARLEPLLVVLPGNSIKVNLNTASAEVIAAVSGYDLSVASRIVAGRQRSPLRSMEDVKKLLSGNETLDAAFFDFKSNYFELHGRLRLERRVLEEVSLVSRVGTDVKPIWRERQSLRELPQ